jgi:Protein of unknown function (DUF3662)/FHA domain
VGVLQRFERRLEGLVNGAFAKAFKSDVQPVEIASYLQRECDERAAVVSRGRTMAPNDFIVELSQHDYERLATYAGPLSAELVDLVQEYGREQHYMFVGPIEVKFEQVVELATGMFRVRSQALASAVQAPNMTMGEQYGAPAGYPQAPPMPGAGGGYPAPGGYPPGPGAMPPGAGAPGYGQGPGLPPAAYPGPNAGYQPAGPAFPPAAAQTSGYWVEINGVRHPLNQPVTALGRGTDVELRIDDPSVSRRHAEIRTGTPSVISDLGSTNGIVVDDQHVRQAQLRDGSVIQLGNTTIIFRQGLR